ncbi:MAG: hypothetical protein ACRDRN_23140, partial [Sciscionella sp.]
VSVGTIVARAAQDVDAARLAEVADEEIAEVAAHGVTAAELERAKAQFESEWFGDTATRNGLAGVLARSATQFGDPARAMRAVDRARAVQLDDVHAVAAQWLRPENRATLIYRKVSR